MSKNPQGDTLRYSRSRIKQLLHGGTAGVYIDAIDATRRLEYAERYIAFASGDVDIIAADPADRIIEKADIERALARIGLTEQQKAVGALLAMGWSLRAIARVLHTDRRAVSSLLDGSDKCPGLAARIEAALNGEEAP